MKKILVIGSGISGLTTSINIAEAGDKVVLVSPFPSERAQSVMAAGGINATTSKDGDSAEVHAKDTLKGGRNIAGEKTVEGLCTDAPEIIKWLEGLGMVFTRDAQGEIDRRALGGHSFKRTAFAGAYTGKHIMTALIQKAREYEKDGKIERLTGYHFHSALIKDKVCYGALLFGQVSRDIKTVYADATVMATGGQNCLFGKTTGSQLCDGYVAGKLFMQGAVLKNPEFIQYHPTSIETSSKRMLITEAARGEGGRLFYMDGDKRVYFMEDKFGPKGNLMPRDVVAKCIYDVPEQVYLDITFLGRKYIEERLKEVDEICMKYLGLDVAKNPIPVSPTVHFFMGGLAVDINHRTSIDRLYAVGEAASIYHGANRLGGNSLLAALHSGRVAAESIGKTEAFKDKDIPDFTGFIKDVTAGVNDFSVSESKFPVVYIRKALEKIMQDDMGISRNGARMEEGIKNLDYYISVAGKINYDPDVSVYQCYSLLPMLTLAKAIITCAKAREETRGAHIREDFPETSADFEKCTLIKYNDGKYDICYKKEDEICW